jgi:hypothetical protein
VVHVVTEKITPKRAAELLERNEINRHLRDRTVEAFAEDMRNDAWNGLNGETIKFGLDGRLKDGQHRLWAIVQADIPVEMLVEYGVPDDAQSTIDTGMRRSYADTLALRGEHEVISLAALVKRVWMWEKENTNETPDRRNPYATTPQLDAVLQRYPELRSIRDVSEAVYRTGGKLAPQSIIALCMWVFARLGDEDAVSDAETFFARFTDGADLPDGSPILTLRKQLQNAQRQPTVGRLNDRVVLAWFIKAWNAYRDGKELRILRFKPGGANPDKFPTPH